MPELRRQKGWSRERLAHHAFAIDEVGTSAAQIAAIEQGRRRPSLRTMTALASALEVLPSVFAEYRLARARGLFDEKEIGLDQAISNLESLGLEAAELPGSPDD